MFFEDASVKEITPKQAKELLESGEAVLLDVRTKEEYGEKHVEGSINIPLNELEARIHELKGKKVIILCFCRSGNRSSVACEMLRAHGFSNIYNVKGGIIAWEKAGFKVVKK